MINRQSVRLLMLPILRRHHRHRHRHWSWDYCLMAAAASSSSIWVGSKGLPFSGFSSRGLHSQSAATYATDGFKFSSLGKVSSPSSLSFVDASISRVNVYNSLLIDGKRMNAEGFPAPRFRGCCCSDGGGFKGADNSCSSSNRGNDNNQNALRKALAFAAAPCPPQQLVCDSDIGRGREDGTSSAHHRGSSLSFPCDQPVLERIVVAVDVDEVLGNFVSALNRFIADRYSLNHSVSEYHVYEFFKIWNCTRDEADIRVHEFFKTHYFKMGIYPIPGARQALQKLSRFCSLSVVTSRQNAIKDHTIEWIEKYYPGLFQEIHFGNHFALDGQSRPKSDICRCLGAKVLIDDNPRYAIECAEVGIRVLLFDYENSYPWCKTDAVNKHPLVTKVHNWEEVEHQLKSWIVS